MKNYDTVYVLHVSIFIHNKNYFLFSNSHNTLI